MQNNDEHILEIIYPANPKETKTEKFLKLIFYLLLIAVSILCIPVILKNIQCFIIVIILAIFFMNKQTK